MRLLILLLLTSCGVNGSGDTVHEVKVSGNAEVEHRIVIDFEVCDDLPQADKPACIDKLLDVLKSLQGGQQ